VLDLHFNLGDDLIGEPTVSPFACAKPCFGSGTSRLQPGRVMHRDFESIYTELAEFACKVTMLCSAIILANHSFALRRVDPGAIRQKIAGARCLQYGSDNGGGKRQIMLVLCRVLNDPPHRVVVRIRCLRIDPVEKSAEFRVLA
jgi:hypothetical protein